MKLLLDTHALIWFVEGDNRLSYVALTFIEDTDNTVYVSITSFFELAIKLKINKLTLSQSIQKIHERLLIDNIKVLPISEKYVFEYLNIPLYAEHKDPFDRIIIATTICENLDIITIDGKFKNYEALVNIIW